MIHRFGMLCLGIVLLSACGLGGASQTGDTQVDSSSTSTLMLEDDTLNVILSQYLMLKDALVASDTEAAAQQGTALADALSQVEGCASTATLALELVQQDDLEEQRQNFSIISQDLIALFQGAKVRSGMLYVAHCPMYMDGKGGDWISAIKTIKNPYYGDKMLACGQVIQEID